MDRGGRDTHEWADPMGPQRRVTRARRIASTTSGLVRRGERCGRELRVLEPGPALGAIAEDPLVRRLAADTLRLGGLRDRPAVEFDAGHQKPPAKDIETGRTMRHESLPSVVVLNTLNFGMRLSFVRPAGNHI